MNQLEAIRAFCLVAQHKSFTLAAQQMHVSVTMVSRYVKNLEQHLGCLLLKRNTRKIFLTEIGTRYFEQIKPLINQFEAVNTQISDLSSTPQGTLTLSTSTELGSLYFVELVDKYQRAYPDVKLDIHLTNTPVDLFNSEVDLVFRIAPALPDANHIAQTICHSSLSLWASPDYLKKFGIPKSISELNQHRLLFFKHNVRKNQWLFALGGEHISHQFDWAMTSNSGRFLNEAAAAAQGIIQAPKYSVNHYVEQGKLVEVLPQYTLSPLTIAAIYPHRYALSNRVKSFVEFARDHFSNHPIP